MRSTKIFKGQMIETEWCIYVSVSWPPLVQRWWLVAWSAPSHYLNQCWNIVNSIPRNKLQWNLNQNSYIFSQENTFANVVCKVVAILSQPQCVNILRSNDAYIRQWWGHCCCLFGNKLFLDTVLVYCQLKTEKFKGNLNQSFHLSATNIFENVICKMRAI